MKDVLSNLGVKQKIILLSSGILLVAMAVLGVLVDHIVTSQELTAFEAMSRQQSKQADDVIDVMTQSMVTSLETLANDPTIRQGGKITVFIDKQPDSSGMVPMTPELNGGYEADLYRLFTVYANKFKPALSVVSYGTTDGGFLQYPAIKRKPGYDSRMRGWYKNSMKQPDKTIVTPPFMTSKGVPTIGIFCVTRDRNNQPLGVLGYNVDLSVLTDVIKNIKSNESSYLLLLDKNGKIIADPQQPENAFKTLEEVDGLKALAGKDGKQGLQEVKALGREMYMTVYDSPRSAGYKYISLEDHASVMAGAREIRVVIVTVLIVVQLLGMLLIYLFMSKIMRPLQSLEAGANEIASGNLSVQMGEGSQDEFGVVAHAFNRMAGELAEVIGKISAASKQVARGSHNVYESSRSLAQGASVQASSVEELSASIAEVANQTKDNAAHAAKADELTDVARKQAKVSNDRMAAMVTAMQDISESSANIARVIKVIDEIAFQTNVLALNAAVEAARAGQNGKGFAVVAEEVRNLAGRSAKATQETTEIIEGSLAKVKEGTKLANETAEALAIIVRDVDSVAEQVGEIKEASAKQSNALAMINQGILQVSDVVQSNSLSSKETAAASESLTEQAGLLQDVIKKFRL